MELTKEQIQHIDNHFKKMGIKYWDLRLEMIDHTVSYIESEFKSDNFEEAFKGALKKFNWRGSLSHLNREGWQNVNRKYRSEYNKGFVNFFKSFKNLSLFIISFLGLYFISENISFNVFNKLCYGLFILPLIIVLKEFISQLFKKYRRSINLDYGVTYMTMSFLLLNAVPLFFKDQGEFIQKIVWFIILPVHFVAFYSGYNLYKKTIVKIEFMKKALTS